MHNIMYGVNCFYMYLNLLYIDGVETVNGVVRDQFHAEGGLGSRVVDPQRYKLVLAVRDVRVRIEHEGQVFLGHRKLQGGDQCNIQRLW